MDSLTRKCCLFYFSKVGNKPEITSNGTVVPVNVADKHLYDTSFEVDISWKQEKIYFVALYFSLSYVRYILIRSC